MKKSTESDKKSPRKKAVSVSAPEVEAAEAPETERKAVSDEAVKRARDKWERERAEFDERRERDRAETRLKNFAFRDFSPQPSDGEAAERISSGVLKLIPTAKRAPDGR